MVLLEIHGIETTNNVDDKGLLQILIQHKIKLLGQLANVIISCIILLSVTKNLLHHLWDIRSLLDYVFMACYRAVCCPPCYRFPLARKYKRLVRSSSRRGVAQG